VGVRENKKRLKACLLLLSVIILKDIAASDIQKKIVGYINVVRLLIYANVVGLLIKQ